MLSSHCVPIPLVGIDPVQPFISELQGRKARTDGETGARHGVGYRVGAIGGLPGLLFLVDLPEAMTALGGPEWFIAAGTAFTIVIVGTGLLLMLGLSAVVGELGARVGGWLATRSNNRHSPATGG
jgi:hypothetical protein